MYYANDSWFLISLDWNTICLSEEMACFDE